MTAAVLIIIFPLWLADSINIQHGYKNYSTYYEGSSPIILLSQHGGYVQPTDIPDREPGCWNGTHCIWEHNCSDNTPYAQDTNNCGIKTLRDAYTQEIALCLRENALLNINGNPVKPHLIVNELYRGKLDANRLIGEATLNNPEAIIAYNDIHFDFMEQAKTAVNHQCGFGLVIDIHGQAVNLYNQMGYRLSDSNLEEPNSDLNARAASSSIYSLATNTGYNLSDIVRGEYSLGTIMNETYDYLMVPSLNEPYLDTDYYYQGGFGIDYHGSEHGGTVDAIQIEVNSPNRWQSNLREQFCLDFSAAVVTFMEHWYDLSQCEPATTQPEPIICSHSDMTNVIDYSKTFTEVSRFRQNREGQTYLDDTLTSFNTGNDCGDINGMDYYYAFEFKRARNRLRVSLHVCCGSGAVFDDNYQPQSGFERVGNGAAFINNFGDSEDTRFGTKEIVVFIICALFVSGLCILGCWKFNKYDMERKNNEVINTVIV